MQKLIVTSAAYRQSSKVTPELLLRDPENRLLARGPRLRLPAEMIRDQVLEVSGLLVEKIGGPAVKPYQPAGLWKEILSADYNQDQAQTDCPGPLRRIVVWDADNEREIVLLTNLRNDPVLHSYVV
jgi:hypothetical protein